jgi:hypothetical protein
MSLAPAPRLRSFSDVFDEEDPVVYILAPSPERPIPAGDTRRGTAYIFRLAGEASLFAAWLLGRHRIDAVPVAVRLRELVAALRSQDLTYLLDPKPRFAYGDPIKFKAPLPAAH